MNAYIVKTKCEFTDHLVLPKYECIVHTWAVQSVHLLHSLCIVEVWTMHSHLDNTKREYFCLTCIRSLYQVWMHTWFILSVNECIHTWSILSLKFKHKDSHLVLPKCECIVHTWAILSVHLLDIHLILTKYAFILGHY